MKRPGSLLVLSLFLAALLAAPDQISGQKIETGFLDRSVVVENIEYRYQVFVPRGYTRSRKWPVILALHGGGEYGDDGVRHTSVALGAAIRRNVSRFQAIVVLPQAKADGSPAGNATAAVPLLPPWIRQLKSSTATRDGLFLLGFRRVGTAVGSSRLDTQRSSRPLWLSVVLCRSLRARATESNTPHSPKVPIRTLRSQRKSPRSRSASITVTPTILSCP